MRKLVAASVVTLGLVSLPSAAHAGSTWLVSIKTAKTQVVTGHKVVFTGTVHPAAAAAGGKVVLQEKSKPGKPWIDQTRARIGRHGRYRISDRPTTNFVHRYRVVMPSSGKHDQGISPTLKVKVYGWSNLVDHQYVNPNYMWYGPVDINGKEYKHSISADMPDASIEYNLDHRCIAFRATFGIDDNSTTGGQAEDDLISDGSNVYTHTFDLGQSKTKTVSLDSPLKLKLAAHSTSTGDGEQGLGAFGTAQVLCIQ
ncbi:MAG: NPCBM/NEW2 domain-containing protein [Nocardioides sp.]